MTALIGLTGFIGFFVCLVLLVIKAIKKKPKKKTLIALGVCFVLFCVALAMPTSKVEEPTPAPTPTPMPTLAAATAKPTETPKPSDTPSDTSDITDAVKTLIEDKLSTAGFDYCSVEGDETGLTISITMDGLSSQVALAKQQGKDETDEGWVTMRDSIVSLCGSVKEFAEAMGMDSPSVMISVLNDSNKENTLLMVAEGIVIYDVMAE